MKLRMAVSAVVIVILAVVAAQQPDWVAWLEVDYARAKPLASDLAGEYATNDSRASSARLDLYENGDFKRYNWPGRNGTGRWLCKRHELSGRWDLQITFDPRDTSEGEHSESGYYIRGTAPDHSIEFFLDDRDNGALVFIKQQSIAPHDGLERNP